MLDFSRLLSARGIHLINLAVLLGLALVTTALAALTDGTDVKVTLDNIKVDGGTPKPSFDAQNCQSYETAIAIQQHVPGFHCQSARR